MIVKRNFLSEDEMNSIRELECICNKVDGTEGEAFLLNTINFDQKLNYIYLKYEENKLISVIILFVPTREEAEITAYTHPQHRLKGHFKELLAEAVSELRKYGVPDILYVVNNKSLSGKGFANKLKLQSDHIEYSMVLDDKIPSDFKFNLKLSFPDEESFEELVKLSMNIFEESEENAREMIKGTLDAKTRKLFAGCLNEKIIGMGSVSFETEEYTIYGFGIRTDFRGKGYGRELLYLIINWLNENGYTKITLEVDSLNETAFKLYKTSGFKIVRQYNYFRRSIRNLSDDLR